MLSSFTGFNYVDEQQKEKVNLSETVKERTLAIYMQFLSSGIPITKHSNIKALINYH